MNRNTVLLWKKEIYPKWTIFMYRLLFLKYENVPILFCNGKKSFSFNKAKPPVIAANL